MTKVLDLKVGDVFREGGSLQTFEVLSQPEEFFVYEDSWLDRNRVKFQVRFLDWNRAGEVRWMDYRRDWTVYVR